MIPRLNSTAVNAGLFRWRRRQYGCRTMLSTCIPLKGTTTLTETPDVNNALWSCCLRLLLSQRAHHGDKSQECPDASPTDAIAAILGSRWHPILTSFDTADQTCPRRRPRTLSAERSTQAAFRQSGCHSIPSTNAIDLCSHRANAVR